jgi:hypothetical protein
MLKIGEFRKVITPKSKDPIFDDLGFLEAGSIFFITKISGDNATYTYDNKNGLSATKPIKFIEECTVSMYSQTAVSEFDKELKKLLEE